MSLSGHQQERILILSVAYGAGHFAAAYALQEEFESRSAQVLVLDPCSLCHQRSYAFTQKLYNFCLRSAPWLWGVMFAQMDLVDWRPQVSVPPLKDIADALAGEIQAWEPTHIVCTYPLYAFILDRYRRAGWLKTPYSVVITDSLAISKPWVSSDAHLIFFPDLDSAHILQERFALLPERVVPAGFPVKRAFRPRPDLEAPSANSMKVLYSASASVSHVLDELKRILALGEGVKLTVLAKGRVEAFKHALGSCRPCVQERVVLLDGTSEMADLMRSHHLYIGKAGAATMFEAAASALPFIVNYMVPGQEQGNVELLVQRGVGFEAESPSHLAELVGILLKNNAKRWREMRTRLLNLPSEAAACIADSIIRKPQS